VTYHAHNYTMYVHLHCFSQGQRRKLSRSLPLPLSRTAVSSSSTTSALNSPPFRARSVALAFPSGAASVVVVVVFATQPASRHSDGVVSSAAPSLALPLSLGAKEMGRGKEGRGTARALAESRMRMEKKGVGRQRGVGNPSLARSLASHDATRESAAAFVRFPYPPPTTTLLGEAACARTDRPTVGRSPPPSLERASERT